VYRPAAGPRVALFEAAPELRMAASDASITQSTSGSGGDKIAGLRRETQQAALSKPLRRHPARRVCCRFGSLLARIE